MSGIASAFGGNSANTDRGVTNEQRGALRNVYGYSLPEGEQNEEQGQGLTSDAGAQFSRMMRSGRTETAQNAAPVINRNLDVADAQRRREALTGTGRTGGTVEADRNQEADVDAANDSAIQQTMLAQKQIGGQGALQAGGDLQSAGGKYFALGQQGVTDLLDDARQSRSTSQDLHNQTYDRVGGDIGNAVAAAFFS